MCNQVRLFKIFTNFFERIEVLASSLYSDITKYGLESLDRPKHITLQKSEIILHI